MLIIYQKKAVKARVYTSK